jgi:CRISPR-associated endonuclease Csn1
MQRKMQYRLGLDMGTTSIGWAMVRLDDANAPCALIRAGVRIFPDGRNPKDGSSLAVTRRAARQMRRRRDRLLKRKQRMLDALTRLGFFPADEAARKALAQCDPYALRAKGLSEALTGPEFARALFHLNQRRGFKSNRKTDRNDSESSTLKNAILALNTRLKEEGCATLGQWLAKRHDQRLSVRARLRGKTQKDKAYDFYADRAMVEHEFDTLWATQSRFNPTLFNDAARDELRDVLLFQRSLKPVKPGRCTLLPDEPRAPLALPSTQRFRIYQELNHLRILQSDLTEMPPLSKAQRDELAARMERKERVTFQDMVKLLKLPGTTRFNLQDAKRDALKGNSTSVSLSKKQHFGDQWHGFTLAQQDEIVWQLLNEPNLAQLVEWLVKHTGVDEACAEQIANAGLPEGCGRFSKQALDRVLPALMGDVITYSDAVLMGGFDSHSALGHAQSTGELLDELPYYGQFLQRHVAFAKDNPRNDEERYGKIANPTVHIALNELRKVMNALIRRYGKPSEVIIEVARELKLGQQRKLEIQREQKERQDLNDKLVTDACEILHLIPAHIDKAKRRELSQKMQLWVELNKGDVTDRRCPYTGEQISIHRLLSSEVEIEHILPYSMTLDDSLNNKTVALRRANRDKGNRSPFDAFGQHAVDGYDYDSILQRASKMPRDKAKRFAPDGYQRWLKDDKDFLARALNDTAYLSRVAHEYVSLLYPDANTHKVRVIPGRMTALLRGKFGLNKLLSDDSTKNRNDHRHHALDAAVIAITDESMLKRFAQASASAREKQLDRLVDEMPFPWPKYREHVARALAGITVSHRPDHGYQGAMHEDTAWGLRGDGMVARKVRAEGESERHTEQKKLTVIPMYGPVERHGLDEATGLPLAYKGYVGGSNYCLEIWRDETGKPDSKVISTYEAYQVIRKHGAETGGQMLRNTKTALNGKPLITRLMIDDCVRLEVDGVVRLMRITVIKSNTQFFMCDHNEANVDARNRDKNDSFGYVSKMPGSFMKAKGRRVTVSPIGDVRDPGFKA